MSRPGFSELTAFTEVAERRSFARAAEALGVTASALSHAVRELEGRLGVRLLHRTTRSVSPTQAGERLLERLRPALADIALALDSVNDWRDRPRGVLRLNVPRAARLFMAPLVSRYLAENPEMRVEVECEDRLVDIVAGGFDAGVRFDEQLEQDMVAVRIGPDLSFVILASPEHLARYGRPTHPDDLAAHPCIRRRLSGGAYYDWELQKGDEERVVEVDGPLSVNDDAWALQAAADGAGLVLGLELEGAAAPWLQSGRLVRVMEDWCPPFPGPYLYYPSKRHMSAGLRAFIDLAVGQGGGSARPDLPSEAAWPSTTPTSAPGA